MHQAQIQKWGDAPVYAEVPDLPAPGPDEIRVKVQASAIHQVVRSRASGKHYSSGPLPHVPGVDAVGTTEDGREVYFGSWATGTLSEYVNIPRQAALPIPSGSDPVQIAAYMNPGTSSMMAIAKRTENLPKDFTVLIIGATSASGRLAVSVARSFGASKIIGAARNKAALDSIGLDKVIVMENEVEKTDFSDLDDVDLVLDYVFGPVTLHLFNSLKTPKPVQYVHIGGLAAQEINIPGAVLRSKNLTIRGSGPGAWDMKESFALLPKLLQVIASAPSQPVKLCDLQDVEKEWNSKAAERLVFRM